MLHFLFFLEKIRKFGKIRTELSSIITALKRGSLLQYVGSPTRTHTHTVSPETPSKYTYAQHGLDPEMCDGDGQAATILHAW